MPASKVVSVHSNLTYSITASNPPDSGTLVYQWYKNGVAIPGATTDTLTLNDVATSDSGTYTVTAGNDGGATTEYGGDPCGV